MFGRLASLFVEVRTDTQKFDAGIARVNSNVTQLAGSLGKLAAQAAGVFLAAGAAATAYGLYKAVQAAGDLNESLSKVDATFGGSGAKVKAYAQEMADRFGIVRKESLDAVAAIGLLAQAAGVADDKAADIGIRFARLAVDLQSFHNMPFEEALDKLRSGLAGEAEPLRAIGVFLTEDAVKAEALAMGLAKSAKEANDLSQANKLLARISLIEKAPAIEKARGDMDRTATSYNNLTKRIAGSFENMKADVGAALLPLATRVVEMLTGAANAIGQFFEDNASGLVGFATELLDFLVEIGSAAGEMAREFGSAVMPAIKEFLLLARELIPVLAQLAVPILQGVVIPAFKALALVVEGFSSLIRWLLGVAKEFVGVGGSVDALKSKVASLPDASKSATDKMKDDFKKLGETIRETTAEAKKFTMMDGSEVHIGYNADKDVHVDRNGNIRHGNVDQDINANAIGPLERLQQGRRLKPGEELMMRRLRDSKPSEYHDLVGFSRMIQANLKPPVDPNAERQIVEIRGVRHEIETQTSVLRRGFGRLENAAFGGVAQ